MVWIVKKIEESSVGGKLFAILSIIWLLFLTVVGTEFLTLRNNSMKLENLYSIELSDLFRAQEAQIDLMFISKSSHEIAALTDIDEQQLLAAQISDAVNSLRLHLDGIVNTGNYRQLKMKILEERKAYEDILVLVLGSYTNRVKVKKIVESTEKHNRFSVLNDDLLTLANLSRRDAEIGFKVIQSTSKQYQMEKFAISIGALLMLSFLSWVVIKAIRAPMSRLLSAIERISQGKLEETLPYVDVHNEIGQLASSIHVLQNIAIDVSAKSALRYELNKLAKAYQSASSVTQLCEINLQHLLELSGGQIGLLYLLEEQGANFVLRAKLGTSESESVVQNFSAGVGVLGNCVKNNRVEMMRSLDGFGLSVNSGSCQIRPEVIAIIPLVEVGNKESVLGLLEIVSIQELPLHFLELLARSSTFFFTKLELLMKADEAENLISKLREQSEVLEAQKARLRKQRIELIEKQDVLTEANAKLQEARTQAEQSAVVKGQFLANMSHEIRTPMNAVIGMTHLALMHEDDPRQRDYLKKIDVASRGLLVVINDILDFSKIDADRLELENVQFKLADVILNATAVLADNAHSKMIEFLVEVDNDVPDFFSGDAARLGQILINILGNAIKFTEAGEVVLSISVGQVEQGRIRLDFSVRDTGLGMSPEQLAQLFQPFVQADVTVTRRFGGTGLGLSISKHLVELMGGEVKVSSELNVGSVFSFTAWFDESQMIKDGERNFRFLNGKHVLVVDDNANARQILSSLLNKLGMRVKAVESAQLCYLELQVAEALDPYDLVFMDWRMPDEDGIAAADRLLHALGLKHIPDVVVVTASHAGALESEAKMVGVKAILEKPVNQSTLYDVLALLSSEVASQRPKPMQSNHLYDLLKGMHVLVAEDNQINQQIVVELLDVVGVRVTLASNGKEALQMLSDAGQPLPWSLVLIDVQMPVMDGYEATVLIRQQPHLSHLPIVALTAHAMQSDYEKSLALGMQAHLTKPLDPTELYGCLLQFVQKDVPKIEAVTIAPIIQARADDYVDENKAFASIRGLDVREGMRYSGNSTRLFQSVLRHFLRYEGVHTSIAESMAAYDLKTAERVAHTLKGVSANVGAKDIAEVSGAIETAIRSGAHLDDIESKLIVLGSLMKELCTGLKSALETINLSEVKDGQQVQDAEELSQICMRISYLLASNDVEAISEFESNRETLKHFLGEAYQAFEDDMQSFDFESAYSRLQSSIDDQFEWM